MAEKKYVMVELDDYEKLVDLCTDREPVLLLRRLYGLLTGNCFIDKNDHWDIDPKWALETAEELYGILGTFENIFCRPPYDEYIYTESERNLLHEVLREREEED